MEPIHQSVHLNIVLWNELQSITQMRRRMSCLNASITCWKEMPHRALKLMDLIHCLCRLPVYCVVNVVATANS